MIEMSSGNVPVQIFVRTNSADNTYLTEIKFESLQKFYSCLVHIQSKVLWWGERGRAERYRPRPNVFSGMVPLLITLGNGLLNLLHSILQI